jgi:hypothetical protein
MPLKLQMQMPFLWEAMAKDKVIPYNSIQGFKALNAYNFWLTVMQLCQQQFLLSILVSVTQP